MENLPALVFAIPILLIGAAFAVQPLLEKSGVSFGKQDTTLTEQLRQRAELLEERSRLYQALLELDFDYSVDKIAQEDYARQRYILVAKSVQVLRQLDSLPEAADDPVEAAIRAYETGQTFEAAAEGCPECGYVGKANDRFCRGCGAPLHANHQEVAHAAH